MFYPRKFACGVRSRVRFVRSTSKTKSTSYEVLFVLARVDKKDANLFKVLFAFICFSFCNTLFPKIRLGDIYFVQLFIRRNGSVTTTTVL